MQDPYKLLGVDKDSSETEINEAYRVLSMKYHPDRNKTSGSGELFEQITRAREVLINSTKRSIYDCGGYSAVKNYEDEIFRSESIKAIKTLKKCPIIKITVPLKITEIYNSVEKSVAIDITQENDRGEVTTQKKLLPLQINSSFEFGHSILIECEGHSKPDHINGDVLIKFVREDEPELDEFAINDNNLVYEKELSLSEAINGYQIPIRHPSGKTIIISGKPIQHADQTVIYEGYGLPITDNDLPAHILGKMKQSYGNLLVKLRFDFDGLKCLSSAERNAIIGVLNAIPTTRAPRYMINPTAPVITGTVMINKGPIVVPLGKSGLAGLGIPGLDNLDFTAGDVKVNGPSSQCSQQ